jgi:hypothetical protein
MLSKITYVLCWNMRGLEERIPRIKCDRTVIPNAGAQWAAILIPTWQASGSYLGMKHGYSD